MKNKTKKKYLLATSAVMVISSVAGLTVQNPIDVEAATAVKLSEKKQGDIITLGGKQYRVAMQKYGGTLVQAVDVIKNIKYDADRTNTFNPNDSNNIGYYLNTTYYNTLSADAKKAIKKVGWHAGTEKSESGTIVNANVGLLTVEDWAVVGMKMGNGGVFPHIGMGTTQQVSDFEILLTKSSFMSDNIYGVISGSNGTVSNFYADDALSIRPALVLNSDYYVKSNGEVVESVNSTPTIKTTIPVQTVYKGATTTVNLANYFQDADGDTLTYTVASSATSRVTGSVSGSTLTLTGVAKGTSNITVTAKDPSGASVSQTFTTNVDNRAPINKATIPAQTIAGKGKNVKVALANYFQDLDGDALTYTVVSNATSRVSGSLIGSALTLKGEGKGPATITVTAKDNSGATATQTFTTTVNNTAPAIKTTMSAQTLNGKGETKTINLANYFQDVDGDTVTYTVVSSATGRVTGSVSGSSLTITGQSPGSATITVTATDDEGGTISQSFTTTVNNAAPTNKTTIPAQTIDGKGKTTTVNLANYFQDADGDTLTYTVASSATGNVTGAVSGSTLTLTGVARGSSNITVTAKDPSGASVTQTFATTVNNAVPTNKAVIPAQTIANKGATKTLDLASYFQDVDGDALTYTVSSNATSRVTTSLSGSNLTLTGVAKGPATITVTATDVSGAKITQTFTTTVNNAVPTGTTIPAQTIANKGATTTVNLANYFQDVDGDALTYTVVSSAIWNVTGTVSGSTLTLTGVAKGNSTITVTATDNSGATVTQTFITTVNNAVPTNKGTIPAQTIANKGATTTVNLGNYFQDADGDALTYTVVSSATGNVTGTVSGSDLTLTGVAKGNSTITVTATDTSGAKTTQTFTTTVNNAAPTNKGTIPAQTITNKGATTTVNLANYFQDVDGDALTYTVVSSATGNVTGTVSGSTLTLTGVARGSSTITVTATDVSGAKITQTFTTTVNNAVPTGTTIPAQTIANKGAKTTVDLASYFTDVDGDALTYTVVSSATGNVTGTVSGSTLTLTGVAKGSSTITVTATDTSGAKTTQTFATTVNNATPTGTTIPAQTIANKGVTKTVDLASYFTDVDGDALTYNVVSSATDKVKGTVSGSTLTLSGVAKGSASITVTATDVSGATVTQTFTTTVNNAVPTGTTIPAQMIANKGATKTVDLASYFTDIDGDALTYTVVSNETKNVTGVVSGSTLTLTGVAKGSSTITVTATDASGAKTTQTFATTVNNATPTGTTIPAQTIANKGATKTVDLASYFTDIDGDALTYTVVSSATDKVTSAVSGSTLTLSGVAKGSSTITVTATDASGAKTTQSFATTVNNAAPTNKGTISSQTITNKDEVITLDLVDYFADIDADNLTYTVVSSEKSTVTATISNHVLTLTGKGVGESMITVTASDNDGGTVNQTFKTMVNIPVPIQKETIPTQVLNGLGQSKQLNLSDYFEDASGALTYTVTSSATNKVETVLNDATLTLNGLAKGHATIKVTAKNTAGETTSQTFTTTVNNTSPTLTTNFNKLNLRPGEVSSVIVLNGIDLDGDNLSYVVTSSNDEIAKVTVSGNQLIVEGLTEGSANVTVKVIDGDVDYGHTQSTKTFTVDVAQPAPIAPEEPIDVDNTGGLTNGSVNLGDIFDDENPADLSFKPNILVNEPEADIFIENQMLVIENPKNDGLISVEVEATNVYGKTAVATLNMLIEVDNSNQNETKDGKATLKLEQGEFTLNTSDSESFGTVKLTAAKQTVTTGFAQDLGVVDARGTQEGWNVTVSATPFTVETFDGFIGTPHQLPVGSLALNNVTGIERINHANKVDGLPTALINGLSVIDTNNSLSILNANQGEGLGEFKFNFGEDALALTVDALTAKIDTVNYPDKNTPYTSTVTWDLISGPQM